MVPPRNVYVIMFQQPSNYSVHLSGSKLSNNQLSEWYLIQENPQNYSMLSFEVCFFINDELVATLSWVSLNTIDLSWMSKCV